MTDIPVTKVCTNCGAELPATLEYFPPDKQMRAGLHSWCRPCFRARIKEYARKYYQQNKEKVAEQRREYYQQNKDKLAEQRREYYQQNKDKLAEQRREYYQKNRAWILEKERERRGSKKIDDDDDYTDLLPIDEYDTFRSWAVITSAEYAAYFNRKTGLEYPEETED